MSGIVGHMMYALLGAQIAARRRLPLAPLLRRHQPSYLCGSYLGSDIQTLPQAVCLDTGQEVGYGGIPLPRSPLTGGPVRPWTLPYAGRDYTPREVHTLFYGRAHLIFGWRGDDARYAVPWDQLPDYGAAVAGDALSLFGPEASGDPDATGRAVAYTLGWLAHVVGDSLIKSQQPGLTLHLLNGTYTPQNRPIQDLYAFYQVGRREMDLDWSALLAAMAATPVEPVQLHYMRVGPRRGALGQAFPDGWRAADEPFLRLILAENRRYLRLLNARWLGEMALHPLPAPTAPAPGGEAAWECHPALRATTGGLTYVQMMALAEAANLRGTLEQIGEQIAGLFAAVLERAPTLRALTS